VAFWNVRISIMRRMSPETTWPTRAPAPLGLGLGKQFHQRQAHGDVASLRSVPIANALHIIMVPTAEPLMPRLSAKRCAASARGAPHAARESQLSQGGVAGAAHAREPNIVAHNGTAMIPPSALPSTRAADAERR